MSKPVLLFQGPVSSRSGYGNHSRDLVRSLIECGKYDVKIWDLRWGGCPRNAIDEKNPDHKIFFDHLLDIPSLDTQPEFHIHVTVPNEFANIGKYNIGITAGMETTMISQQWVEGCNKMDLIIVPSNHCKKVFQSTVWKQQNSQTQEIVREIKVVKPIEVLFEGTRSDIYKKITQKDIPQTLIDKLSMITENWCYLYVGHWLQGDVGHDRKDTGMLVKVFLETFKNKKNTPALILKTSGATFSVTDRDDIFKKIEGIKKSVKAEILPNIYLIHGDLTDEEMNGLYNHPKVKAHVTFTKGEGFGRPLLEASMSEKPIIASGWSGHLDFLDKNLAVLLPGGLSNVHASAVWENVILKESQWFTVNYVYASQILKDVWANYRKYITNAKLLTQKNKSQFSYSQMVEKFMEIMEQYIPKFLYESVLDLSNLPKLTKIDASSNETKINLPKLKRSNKSDSDLSNVEQSNEFNLPKLKMLE